MIGKIWNTINLPPILSVQEIGAKSYYVTRGMKLLHISPSGEALKSVAASADDAIGRRMTLRSTGKS